MSAATERPIFPRSPCEAAEMHFGADAKARIERFHLDGTRSGMTQGRCAAWNWAYRVYVPSVPHALWGDRGLADARRIAACHAATVVEDWAGGKTFARGARGGLTTVAP